MERSRAENRSTISGRPGRRVALGLVGTAMATLCLVTRVEAMSNYLSTTWPGLYPDSTADDNAGCQLCHAGSTQNLNPYGHAICVGSGDIGARIQAAEGLDSDGDPTGATNREEIDADTQPGWTPGAVNLTYNRNDCSPTGNTEAPPSFIPEPLDPAPAATCGDDIVDPGEDCDGGPCCAADCTFATAGTACDDGDFCTDGDACDGAGICEPGAHRNCSDGVGCTVDTCDSANATCVNTPDDANCADDGLFCNGAEFCDAVNDCASTGNPCEAGTVCNDVTDTCDPQAACGNGVVEAGEECDGGPCCADDCTFATAGSACDDGDFCTTGDACDGAGACLAGGPTDCSDGVGCTVDTCDSANAACVHTPDDGFCDNGTFCDGVEICDPANDCTSPGDPCPAGTLCDEASDACEPIAGCGDGILQAGEACDDGNTADGDCCSADCQFEAVGSLCDDGQFCTTGEVCDGAGTCGGGQPLDCGDGIACTDDACDEANATCVHTPNDAHCADDGLFCTGQEFCDPANDCSTTGDPCDAGTTCNEDTDACEPSAAIVDLDIVRLKVTKNARLGREVRIELAVHNGGDNDGARPATVVGEQDHMEIYRVTLDVSDPPGDGATKVRFPSYTPAAVGIISWKATVDDDDPDMDEAIAATRVVGGRVDEAAPAAAQDHGPDGADDDDR